MHRHGRAVYMQFSHNTAPTLRTILLDELWTEGSVLRALSQPQQADEDIPLWIFVRQERFPPPVRRVISAEKFYRLRADFVVDFVDLNGVV